MEERASQLPFAENEPPTPKRRRHSAKQPAAHFHRPGDGVVEPDADDAQSLEALFNLYIGLTGTEDDGWIFAESQSGKRGWVPAAYLDPIGPVEPKAPSAEERRRQEFRDENSLGLPLPVKNPPQTESHGAGQPSSSKAPPPKKTAQPSPVASGYRSHRLARMMHRCSDALVFSLLWGRLSR